MSIIEVTKYVCGICDRLFDNRPNTDKCEVCGEEFCEDCSDEHNQECKTKI